MHWCFNAIRALFHPCNLYRSFLLAQTHTRFVPYFSSSFGVPKVFVSILLSIVFYTFMRIYWYVLLCTKWQRRKEKNEARRAAEKERKIALKWCDEDRKCKNSKNHICRYITKGFTHTSNRPAGVWRLVPWKQFFSWCSYVSCCKTDFLDGLAVFLLFQWKLGKNVIS